MGVYKLVPLMKFHYSLTCVVLLSHFTLLAHLRTHNCLTNNDTLWKEVDLYEIKKDRGYLFMF